jgi:hypothetical protein
MTNGDLQDSKDLTERAFAALRVVAFNTLTL